MTILTCISLITIYFNQMLNWCQNSTYHDDQSEIHFNSSLQQAENINRTLPPPKLQLPNQNKHQPRMIKPQTRKGIKTHFDRSSKMDKQIQVILPYNMPKALVDCGTQTVKIGVQMIRSQRKSTLYNYSLQVSPRNQNLNPNLSQIEKSKYTNQLQQNLPKSIYYKNEQNKQTKATYCLVDTKHNNIMENRSRFYTAFGVESYHIPVANKSQLREEQQKKTVRFHKIEEYEPCTTSLQKNYSEKQSQLTFSNKYRKMLKNVESEFKLSEKKQSQKKFKNTPPKKTLFNQRQTIVSKYDNQRRQSQRSLLVQQSILYQPDIRSCFTPINQMSQHSDYTIYLAKQKLIGFIVSIKEITIEHMNRISEQLLIYKQIEPHITKMEGILNLYQTQIDRGSYMLIKQPYTQNILQYLRNGGNLTDVSVQIQTILITMQKLGFILRQWLRVEDLVVCLAKVKIQSVGVFTLDKNFRGIRIQQALQLVRQQIIEQLS